SVLPPAPMRPLAKTRLEVPAVALKPGRSLPGAHMGVHAGCDLSQSLEGRGVCRGGLLSLLPGEENDVARPRQALMGDGLDEPPVVAPDRGRGNRGARCLERYLPLKFGSDRRARVITLAVHAQRPLGPCRGIVQAVGRVL